MFRTRDFVVGMVLLLALFSSGGAVAVLGLAANSSQLGAVTTAFDPQAVPVEEKAAVVPELPEPDRVDSLAIMRDKVAARIGAMDLPQIDSEPPVVDGEEAPDSAETASVQLCSTYSQVGWNNLPGAQFREAEGARIIYRPLAASSVGPAASGTVGVPLPTEEVLAQLPLRSQPLPSPTCIPQDVIGIALDGSLIRNDEIGLYRVFGSDTLIGYTLDGFSLYGVSALPTDDCGGTMVGGAYRYYLSLERETILQCFAGVPVGL